LAGKRILYTGAAGGLGLGTTLELLALGGEVIAIDNDEAKARTLRDAVPSEQNKRFSLLQPDLADHAALRHQLDDITAARAIGVGINIPATEPSKPCEEYSPDDMRAVHAVNVEAALGSTHAALPGMRQQGWGRTINVPSITLSGGWANLTPHVQSKGAL